MEPSEESLYDTDFYQWLQQQKKLLLNRQFDLLDLDNLIDEVEDMGGELDMLETRLTTLLLHLLKYDYQVRVLNPVSPEPYNCREWLGTIDRSRVAIQGLIEKKPHLKPERLSCLHEAYPKAKKLAIKDMNRYVQPHQLLDNSSFPNECPWTFEQITEEDWLP